MKRFGSRLIAIILKTDSTVKIALNAVSSFCVAVLCALFFVSVVVAEDFRPRIAPESSGLDARLSDSVNSQLSATNQDVEKSPSKQQEKEPDPFRRDRNGVQTYFPAVAKIVGRSGTKTNEEGVQTTPYYYGTGTLVAEYESWGIVVTNWHVVSEATESVDVYFPSGVYSARVILRDDVWDLAALIVIRPRGITPVPVSTEAPRIGDTFWVGGYGQSNGLSDFQMGHGKLTNYVSLVDPDENVADGKGADSDENSEAPERLLDEKRAERLAKLIPSPLYETASIKYGVRQGDSGGPIFNRYGELAGILWGSDGKCTMGTTGVRLQSFLTQAIWRSAEIYAENRLESEEKGVDPVAVLPWKEAPSACPAAEYSNVDMHEALRNTGTFPVSKKMLYYPANNENPEEFTRLGRNVATARVERASLEYLRKNEYAVPPSPPIFSPTYVVMQIDMQRVHPEVADDDAFDALDAYSLAKAKKARDEAEFLNSRALWASLDENSSRMEIAATVGVVDDETLDLGLDNQPRLLPVSDNAVKQTDSESAPSDEKTSGEAEGSSSENSDVADEGSSDVDPLSGGSRLSVLTIYVVVILIFFIFFFSVRLMNGSSDPNYREKGRKTRLQREK